jgi:hypothetical protein
MYRFKIKLLFAGEIRADLWGNECAIILLRYFLHRTILGGPSTVGGPKGAPDFQLHPLQ